MRDLSIPSPSSFFRLQGKRVSPRRASPFSSYLSRIDLAEKRHDFAWRAFLTRGSALVRRSRGGVEGSTYRRIVRSREAIGSLRMRRIPTARPPEDGSALCPFPRSARSTVDHFGSAPLQRHAPHSETRTPSASQARLGCIFQKGEDSTQHLGPHRRERRRRLLKDETPQASYWTRSPLAVDLRMRRAGRAGTVRDGSRRSGGTSRSPHWRRDITRNTAYICRNGAIAGAHYCFDFSKTCSHPAETFRGSLDAGGILVCQ